MQNIGCCSEQGIPKRPRANEPHADESYATLSLSHTYPKYHSVFSHVLGGAASTPFWDISAKAMASTAS